MLWLWRADNPDAAEDLRAQKKTPKKSMITASLLAAINEASAKSVLTRLTHAQLEHMAKPAPIQHKQNYVKKDGTAKYIPVPVYEKRLTELVTGKDYDMCSFLHAFFDKDREYVIDLLDTFEIEFDEAAKTKDLVDTLNTQVGNMGLHSYLESVPLDVLQDVAIKEKLTKKVVTSRDRIVEGLLTNKLPEKRVVATGEDDMPTLKEIGSKKSISKSDYWGMWQHYNLVNIVEYCKKNNIKSSGTKKEVIERIIEWREADKENKKKFEVKEEVLARVAARKSSLASEKKKQSKKSSEKKEKKEKKKILESDEEDEEEEEKEEVVKPKKEVVKKVEKEEPKVVKKNEKKEEPKEKVVKKTEKKEEPKEKVVKKTEKKEEPKVVVKENKKTSEVMEEDEEEDEEEVEEKEEKEEKGLKSLDSVDEDEQVDVIKNPENYTLATLIKLCEFNTLTVPDSVKTREDYIKLINSTVLDLDNLDRYSLESLKAYVKETELEVTGKGRQAYVDAIIAAGEAVDEEEEEASD